MTETKMLMEAIVRPFGRGSYEMNGSHEMGEPIESDAATVDDWVAQQDYNVVDVTYDWRGAVRLPRSVLTDRHIRYFAVRLHPDDDPVVYAVWADATDGAVAIT